MKRSISAVIGARRRRLTLVLAGCGGGDEPVDRPDRPGDDHPGRLEPVDHAGVQDPRRRLPRAAPERDGAAQGVRRRHNYDTQMITDLAAGTAPDVYVMKNLKNFYTYQSGGQLLDVSDVASRPRLEPGAGVRTRSTARRTRCRTGRTRGCCTTTRTCSTKAKVAPPDGSWTWDDYAEAAKRPAHRAEGGRVERGRRRTSTPGSRPCRASRSPRPRARTCSAATSATSSRTTSRVLDLQDAGAQPTFGTATTNKLTYQAQFGKQQAAMMLMGTWYVATLLNQQKSGDADTFEWGIAPAPQFDAVHHRHLRRPRSPSATRPASASTRRSPTGQARRGQGVPRLRGRPGRRQGAGRASASRRPHVATRSAQTYSRCTGVPTDDLSKFAWSKHNTKPENPVSKHTAGLQNVLNDTALGGPVRQQERRRAIERGAGPGQERGPQPVTLDGAVRRA